MAIFNSFLYVYQRVSHGHPFSLMRPWGYSPAAGDDFWDLLRRLGDCYVNDLQNRGPALNDELLLLAASTCVYKPVINELH